MIAGRFLRFGMAAAALLAAIALGGQGVLQQAGPATKGHVPVFFYNGVVGDSGPAQGGGPGLGLSELLVVAQGTGTPPFAAQGTGPLGTIGCFYDAPITNPTGYHYICFSPNALGASLIAIGAGGIASPLGVLFDINGVQYGFPGPGNGNVLGPGSSINSDYACFNGTTGTTIKDCGLGTQKSTVTIAAAGSGAITTTNAQVTVTGLTATTGNSQSVTVTFASIAATSLVQATWAGGTTAGFPVLKPVAGSGSLTLTLFNAGSATFNGTAIVNLAILP